MTADETLDRLREIRRQIAILQKEQEALILGRDTTRRAPRKRLSAEDIDVAFAGILEEKPHEYITS